ncbi:DUF1107 domain-containing protein [Vibrio sp. WXL103]|uniref:DUF1107 domain-containing protein n=1 Tax=unclassified Vibrio TaxID=2614977 RepID=UPI003EC921E4
MLREFAKYRPLQVAKFVKTLFKGNFTIKGIGCFEFDNGKILLPDVSDPNKLAVYKEINGMIANM